jgi:hypothetical protein
MILGVPNNGSIRATFPAGGVARLERALYRTVNKSRLFVLITAYVDESGTHNSGVTVVAACAANSEQWSVLESKSKALFDEFKLTRAYHSKELWDSDNDFKKWSVDKKISFHDEISDLVNRHVEISGAAILRDDDYYRFYRNDTLPKKKRSYESRYCLCFRTIIGFLLNSMIKEDRTNWPNTSAKTLDIVADRGHKNSEEVIKFFNLYKDDLMPDDKHFLKGLAYQDKEDCLPLFVPDHIARPIWQSEVGIPPKMLWAKSLKCLSSYKKNIWRISIEEETLHGFRKQLLSKISHS